MYIWKSRRRSWRGDDPCRRMVRLLSECRNTRAPKQASRPKPLLLTRAGLDDSHQLRPRPLSLPAHRVRLSPDSGRFPVVLQGRDTAAVQQLDVDGRPVKHPARGDRVWTQI
jgi:hypothetical protein